MKRSKIQDKESYTLGNLNPSTISYFLKHLDNFNIPRAVKHKLKVVLMELVSNIIVHAETAFGSVSIQQYDNHFVIKTANFVSGDTVTKTAKLLSDIKKKANLRNHYLDLMSKVTFENQVSLGLIEIARLSEGKIEISASEQDGKQVMNFEIKLIINP